MLLFGLYHKGLFFVTSNDMLYKALKCAEVGSLCLFKNLFSLPSFLFTGFVRYRFPHKQSYRFHTILASLHKNVRVGNLMAATLLQILKTVI